MRSVPLFLLVLACAMAAAEIDANVFAALHWRLIGPFRAGRVTAVAGVPGQPNVYYFGTPGGGIWKSTDAGRVWKPIFDQEHVASIGALVLAPSDSNIIFAGTGEQTPGHGVYRSNDGGASWMNIGLRDVRYIQAIAVDPHDPNILVVAGNSLGVSVIVRPVPKQASLLDRGIYKTTDGGKSWRKVLSKDDSAGVVDLCADPGNPQVLFVSVYYPGSGTGDSAKAATSEIWKSSDEGSTWKALASKGLPEKDRGRLGIVVAPGNEGRRIYAILKQGFYRSDDGGATWQRSTTDTRVIGSEYFSRIFVDPLNADVSTPHRLRFTARRMADTRLRRFVGAPARRRLPRSLDRSTELGAHAPGGRSGRGGERG